MPLKPFEALTPRITAPWPRPISGYLFVGFPAKNLDAGQATRDS